MAYFSKSDLTPSKKYLIFGISAAATAIISYFIYKKLAKPKRSGSQSSTDSDNDINLIN